MGHRLVSGAAPACRVPHGHDEVVTVDIAAGDGRGLDPETNMLVEFERAKGRWFEFVDGSLDHSFHVSDRDPLVGWFRENEPELLPSLLVTPGDPTTEVRAACYFAKANALLEDGLACVRVELRETPTNAVEIHGSNAAPGDGWWTRPDFTINDLAPEI